MVRRILLATFLSLAAMLPVGAEERPLTGPEIIELLSGNTAIGLWLGTPYRQWFAAGGLTIYAPQEQRSSVGKWRVTADGTDYESWWSGPDWERFSVAHDGEDFFWISPDGARTSFEILPGQQLVWLD